MKSLPSQSLYSSRRDREETSSRELNVMTVIKKNEVEKIGRCAFMERPDI